MSEASLDMELGDYAAAGAILGRYGDGGTDASEAVASRFAELHGDLARARALLGRAARRTDAVYGIPNERRAWFHVRLGELAFAAGDADAALLEEKTALERFSGRRAGAHRQRAFHRRARPLGRSARLRRARDAVDAVAREPRAARRRARTSGRPNRRGCDARRDRRGRAPRQRAAPRRPAPRAGVCRSRHAARRRVRDRDARAEACGTTSSPRTRWPGPPRAPGTGTRPAPPRGARPR